MILKKPRGGLWLELKKSPASEKPLAHLAAPAKIYLPIRQYQGDTAHFTVARGSRVLMGQPVSSGLSGGLLPLHSPVSGTVLSIVKCELANGSPADAAIIENDGKDTPFNNTYRKGKNLIEKVMSAGVVCSGESGEPYWKKLKDISEHGASVVVINAVETEPFICASQKIIDEMPDETADGLNLIMKCAGAEKAILAAGDDIPREITDCMAESAKLKGIELSVAHIPQKYPNGNEKFLLRAVFAHEAGSGQGKSAFFTYPQDCVNVYKAAEGAPQISRIITVAGDAVENPQNIEVMIGTRIGDVLDRCGLSFEPERVVVGSAMRGVAVQSLDIPVTKDVSAVLALKKSGRIEKPICINCGKCVGVCPQGLLPNHIAMRAVKSDFGALNGLRIDDCIECGSCAYICPGRMPILELIKKIKKVSEKPVNR